MTPNIIVFQEDFAAYMLHPFTPCHYSGMYAGLLHPREQTIDGTLGVFEAWHVQHAANTIISILYENLIQPSS